MRNRYLLYFSLVLALTGAPGAFAQNETYSRINPLESAVSSGTASRDQKLELARLYNQVGRYYEASKLAQAVLAENANDADATAVRAEAQRGLRAAGEKKIAAAEIRGKASDATDQERLALADAYFEGGRYADAADLYAKMPESLQTRDVRLRQARALSWTSRHGDAERIYSRLLAEESTPELELEYGRVLSWMGAADPSVKTLARVYERSPNEDAAIALANAYAWSNNREQALRTLRDFTSTHPDAPQAKALLDQMTVAPELRLERISKLIDLEPYNLALRVDQARLQMEAGSYSEALKTVKFVREHAPQDIPGLDEIDRQVRAGREAELAKANERKKVLDARNPSNADEMLALAKAYTGLSDYDNAIRLYEDYLALRPNDAQARTNYARVLSWDRRYSAAARQYEKLIEQNPDRADLRLEYAQILSYDRDYVDAVHMFSSLTDLKDNPQAHLYQDVPVRAHTSLGQIYRWFGWNEHALQEQNYALGLDNDYFPAQQELSIVRRVRPASTLDARYTYATDSSDFTLRRYDLTGEKWVSQRLAWNASVGRHYFDFRDQSATATAGTVGATYRFADRLLGRARVGLNAYDRGLGTRPFFGVGAEWRPNLQSRGAIDFNHYDLVYDVFNFNTLGQTATPNADLRDPLTIDDLRGHYDWDAGGHWSALGDLSYGHISDGNNRAGAHGLLSFRLFKQPFVAVKGEGHWLRYDERTNRYWSPTDYNSLAGVLQVGQNIRNRFYWTAEYKYGKAWEGDRTSDVRAWAARLTVPVTDIFDIVGSYSYGRSGRFDSVVNSGNDFINYWQRYWYVGVRLKQLYNRNTDENGGGNPYYYDNKSLNTSPVIPLGGNN
jgi:tetratricopeptide (TPR) repeat protein